MEQGDLVPFSKFIASLLLYRRKLIPVDIVNVMSELESRDICIDDYNDSIDNISCCVRMNSDCSFELFKNYNDYIDNNTTVYGFLLKNSDSKINGFLNYKNSLAEKNVKSHKKILGFGFNNKDKKIV